MSCHHDPKHYIKLPSGFDQCKKCGATWIARTATQKKATYPFPCEPACGGELHFVARVATVTVYRCMKCEAVSIEP